LRLELATQINHRVELFPEVVEAYRKIMDRHVAIYAQNVLLRGVNDDLDTLVDLYDGLRDLGIQPYYLFHCVPLMGMGHLRTTVERAIRLVNALTSSGRVCGRAKPMLAAMTEIGKIVLYDGGVVRRDQRHLLLQSHYRVDDRHRWNPNWRLPANAEVDRNGLLRVWYLDGQDGDEAVDDAGETELVRCAAELDQPAAGPFPDAGGPATSNGWEPSATCVRQPCGRT
jgi:lysine 2,3-aminomutase